MARLPYVTPADAPEHVRRILEKLPPLNIFGLIANAQSVFTKFCAYSTELLTAMELDPVLREMAILRTARLTPGAEYEWVQHAAIHLAVGGTQEQVDALERDDLDAFDGAQRHVLDATTQLIQDARIAPATLHALGLPPSQVVELILVVGQYRTIGTLMATAEIDLDPAFGGDVLDVMKGAAGS